MRYKQFNGEAKNFEYGGKVPKLEYYGDVVMAIDPSKTNCAVIVGDPFGNVISILEFSGNNWKAGPVMNTTEYCAELRYFLKEYLAGRNVVRIGLEKAITKKGMTHHHSNMVLTEIRGVLLGLFYELYGLRETDVEVNNWAWKRAILPDGYRSQSEKGSRRYFIEYLNDTRFVHYHEADVTDCMCIYKYIIRDLSKTYKIMCTHYEDSKRKYQLHITSNFVDSVPHQEFTYNSAFTLEENATYYANRGVKKGIAKIPISDVSIADIYKYSALFFKPPEEEYVRLVIDL